jgi:hypothetical protein
MKNSLLPGPGKAAFLQMPDSLKIKAGFLQEAIFSKA